MAFLQRGNLVCFGEWHGGRVDVPYCPFVKGFPLRKVCQVSASRFTVLHVEDDPDHAHLVGRTLQQRNGVDVHWAADGEKALDYLLRRNGFQDPKTSPRPDLVLLDLRLPKVDGLEILERIKSDQELLKIPVVIFTSSEAEKDVAQAYSSFVNSYLVKPVGFEDFRKMMDHLAAYWLDWNRYPSAG